MIFDRLDRSAIEDHAADWKPVVQQAREMTLPTLQDMKKTGQAEYGGYMASLFKNAT